LIEAAFNEPDRQQDVGMKHTFLTGATGLLGSQLMADLLQAGTPLAVLVRSTKKQSGRERIESILQQQEKARGQILPRPVVLEGDLNRERCGIDTDGIDWIGRACDRIVHSGASLQFIGHDRKEEPWRTNVGGTQHVLEISQAAAITDFWHISTAYVCGLANGTVLEQPSTAAHGFRNDYEASKHEAEMLVRAADWLPQPTFVRPAVIVGHSRTGATTTYHGLMAMLQLMTVIVRSLPADESGFRHVQLRLAMTGDERRNLVPVDWVSETLTLLLQSPTARGLIFHLAPDRPITTREVIDHTSSYLNSGGLQFVGTTPPDDMTLLEEMAYMGKGLYESYEDTDPVFSMENLHSIQGVRRCPMIDEAMIHRFLAFGDQDRWGKRRKAPVTVARWVEDVMDELLRAGGGQAAAEVARLAASGAPAEPPAAVGLECVGPGGGAWTVAMHEDGETQVEPGRPASPAVTIRLETSRLIHYARLAIASCRQADSLNGKTAGRSLFSRGSVSSNAVGT
jgi:thioester reductase-like protein